MSSTCVRLTWTIHKIFSKTPTSLCKFHLSWSRMKSSCSDAPPLKSYTNDFTPGVSPLQFAHHFAIRSLPTLADHHKHLTGEQDIFPTHELNLSTHLQITDGVHSEAAYTCTCITLYNNNALQLD